jgi:pimeloyl-ACP methyl ester carboxylesterase
MNNKKMKKKTILSGFGQNPEILEEELFKKKETISLDYLQYKNFEDLTKRDLKIYDNEVVIGWSLGGQVACRLIEKGILKPKLLILIASPYSFKISQIKFFLFKILLFLSKKGALKYLAWESSLGDYFPEKVKENMQNFSGSKYLANWLEELNFDFKSSSFENFPETIYISGDNDKVVGTMEGYDFQLQIENKHKKNFTKYRLKNCGHAPHFSHKEKVLRIINESLNDNNSKTFS